MSSEELCVERYASIAVFNIKYHFMTTCLYVTHLTYTHSSMCNTFYVRNSTIRHLVHPLCTVLDDSIGCALWFASRGRGLLYPSMQPYQSNARVIYD